MRDPIENISKLQKQLNDLQIENQILKNLLEQAGVTYKQELKEKQENGTQITIVTWEPDMYAFGDVGFWMQLHEDIRQAGFYIKTVEESCEHFAIIDQNIVWYGNINILAKPKAEDSMMRVESREIASELMELMFGDEKGA